MRAMSFPLSKVRITSTLVAAGLLGSSTLRLPVRELSLPGWSCTVSGGTILGLLLVGLTCTGMQAIVSDHPGTSSQSRHRALLHWILPTLLTATAWASMDRLGTIQHGLVGASAAGAALAALMTCEHRLAHSDGHRRPLVLSALRLSAYAVATILYAAIPPRISVAGAAAVTLSSTALVLRLIWDDGSTGRISLWLAVGLGAALGALSLATSFRSENPLQHALELVIVLYTSTGLARHWLLGRLTRRVLAEFAVIATVAFALLVSFAH